MSRGKQIFSVFTGRLTFGTGVKMIMQLTNTAPFSMSGTTTGTKPCKRQTPTEVFPIWTPRKNQPTFILLSSFVLPFAVVCQGQSSEVQSEVGLLLLSGSRTCGLRHELAVFRGGGRYAVVTIHTSTNHKLSKITVSSVIYTTERNRTSLSAFGGVSEEMDTQVERALETHNWRSTRLNPPSTSASEMNFVFLNLVGPPGAHRGLCAANELNPHVNSFGQRKF